VRSIEGKENKEDSSMKSTRRWTKTVSVALLVVLLAVFGTVTLAAQGGQEAEGPTVYRLGYGGAVTNPRHLSAEQFAAYVNEESDGEIRIDLFPSEMLGTDAEMVEMASMGSLDMTINAVGVVQNYEPKIAVFELPFLFETYEKVDKVLDSELGMGLLDSLPAQGLRGLAYWENGLRQITNSVRPIEKPADLQGIKLRTPENEMTLAIFRALGARPSPLAFSELYLALSQKSFDGQENPIANIHASRFDEVQDYLTISNHKYEALVFLVSESVWKKMPQDHKDLIAQAAKEFGQVHRDMVRSAEEEMIADLEQKGMKVSRPDLAPFVKATEPVYKQFEPVFGKDLIDQVRAMTAE
jgi:tripartite ATP-independent transporter DctP family solute receptor